MTPWSCPHCHNPAPAPDPETPDIGLGLGVIAPQLGLGVVAPQLTLERPPSGWSALHADPRQLPGISHAVMRSQAAAWHSWRDWVTAEQFMRASAEKAAHLWQHSTEWRAFCSWREHAVARRTHLMTAEGRVAARIMHRCEVVSDHSSVIADRTCTSA